MVLSDDDLRFFAKHGWVIARQVIDAAQCERTAAEVWEFAGLSPGDPATWAEHPKPGRGGMYHGHCQWENRTAPRVHEAFSKLWGTRRLWNSHDSTNLNFPVGDPQAPEGDLHWDCDMRLWSLQEAKARRPIVGGVQGVLYLVDTPAANGAFVCIPGFHLKLDAWLDTLPPDTDNLRAAMNDEFRGSPDIQRIEANAGDLVIWDSRLPHGRGVNRGDSPRVSQYIAHFPAPADVDARR
eukprot:SAG22_NODE_4399_length_1282_cov_1.389687_1_plen_237_part_10